MNSVNSLNPQTALAAAMLRAEDDQTAQAQALAVLKKAIHNDQVVAAQLLSPENLRLDIQA